MKKTSCLRWKRNVGASPAQQQPPDGLHVGRDDGQEDDWHGHLGDVGVGSSLQQQLQRVQTETVSRRTENPVWLFLQQKQPSRLKPVETDKNKELTRFSWRPSCGRFRWCRTTEENRPDSTPLLSAASLPPSRGCCSS